MNGPNLEKYSLTLLAYWNFSSGSVTTEIDEITGFATKFDIYSRENN